MKITETEKDVIKRILCIRSNGTFVRCPARDMVLVRKFREQGDHSHDAPAHCCEKCRCRNTAGMGTKGDFYGIGEHTGHFGVGFCARHEKGRHSAQAENFARNQMKALQNLGKAHNPEEDYELVSQYEAQLAEENQEIRQGIILIRETLDEFKKKCNGETRLTEMSGGFEVSMCDKSRMELACKLATTISTLAKDKYALESEDYVHIDEIKMRIPQMISLVYRFLMNKEDRDKFLVEFKSIWRDTRRGARQLNPLQSAGASTHIIKPRTSHETESGSENPSDSSGRDAKGIA